MFTRLPQQLAVCLVILASLYTELMAADDPDSEPVLTQAAQFAEPLKSRVRRLVQARLTGVVYGVDRVHPGIVLKDESGWLWLETESLPEAVEPGAQVLVEGTVTAGKGRAFLGKTAIVEGDYYNDLSRQSGRLYLSAGKHALELLYHQASQRALLEVDFQGPGFSRREIPTSALSYEDTNAPGNFLTGLRYDCYRGSSTSYSDFANAEPEFSGVAPTFFGRFITPDGEKDIPRSDRQRVFPNVNFTLRFTGNLEIQQPGFYQFSVVADDGARLVVDYDSKCRIEVIGHTNLTNAIRLDPAQAWGESAEPLWAIAEGTVKHVGEFNGRLLLTLEGDTGSMQATVANGDISASPMLLNNRVRVSGLAYSTTTFHDGKVAGKIIVPSMTEVVILNASEANWHTYPDYGVGYLLSLSEKGDHTPVHIFGEVVEVVPGKSILVKDETGQIEVQTTLARSGDKGKVIEVLGLSNCDGQKTALRYAAYRRQSELTPDQPLPLLTSIEQIRRLKENELNLRHPVRFKGTVTFVLTGGLKAYVRGESEGIAISTTNVQLRALRLGDLCRFEGNTEWKAGTPTVNYSKVAVLSRGHLPEPRPATWNELMNGSLDSQWVEVQGVVLNVNASASSMVIGMSGGEITVHIAQNSRDVWSRYTDSVVRIRGIVDLNIAKNQQVRGATLEVDSPLDVTVVTPSPKNLFSLTTRKVSDLLAFDPNASIFPFVKVAGQVVHVRGSTFYLMDGTNGLHFATRNPADLTAGDVVEVVGIPENDRLSRHLNYCYVKKIRNDPLPVPPLLSRGTLTSDTYESTLVQFDTILLNTTTNRTEQVLELQLNSSRIVLGKLDNQNGQFPKLQSQSRVRVKGVFTAARTSDSSPEILMKSPADLEVVATPPWWDLRHSLFVLGLLSAALVITLTWVTALRRRVEQRTCQLHVKIEEHQRTEQSLNEKTILLQNENEERKRAQLEVERIHRQLVDASRQAGQAEVAVNVLHNVGNVLNSVNVSTSVITKRVRGLHLGSISKAANVLEERIANSAVADEKGHQLLDYLKQLALHLGREQQDLLTELGNLGQNVEHIKEIVATQQSYAKRLGIFEKMNVAELVENALKVHSAAFIRHSVRVERVFEPVPEAILDKHKVLQILVNFLQNAKYACDERRDRDKTIIVRIRRAGEDRACIEVSDNGIGIAPENINRIFTHGFTTRKDGHGFGLHSAALAANEMGGNLTVSSDGIGMGATFILELPLKPADKLLGEQTIKTVAEGVTNSTRNADSLAALN